MLSLERGDRLDSMLGQTQRCAALGTLSLASAVSPGSPSWPSPVQQTALSSTSTEALKPEPLYPPCVLSTAYRGGPTSLWGLPLLHVTEKRSSLAPAPTQSVLLDGSGSCPPPWLLSQAWPLMATPGLRNSRTPAQAAAPLVLQVRPQCTGSPLLKTLCRPWPAWFTAVPPGNEVNEGVPWGLKKALERELGRALV